MAARGSARTPVAIASRNLKASIAVMSPNPMTTPGAGLKLRRMPVKPKASPLGLLSPQRIHPSWRNFLDVVYWNVELG